MIVTRLQITPVKGMELHDVTAVDLDACGVAENRRFYLIDRDGLMFNGKRDGRIVRVRADYDASAARLTFRFPDGAETAGIVATGDAVTTSFYGRPVRGHRVVGPWSAALSTYLGEAVDLVVADRAGDAVDVHPVTLVSQGSLERLRASAPPIAHLPRRFRMLVETDGCDAYEEETWIDRRVAIGAAVISIVGPVPRCVVVTQDPLSGERDFDTLRAIVADRGATGANLATPTAHLPDGGKVLFGVYGTVVTPGRIAVGDTIALA